MYIRFEGQVITLLEIFTRIIGKDGGVLGKLYSEKSLFCEIKFLPVC